MTAKRKHRQRKYPAIRLSRSVPAGIRSVVRKRIEPILHDVRAMLAQPKRSGPAFNFSATIVLACVVGGLARVFDSRTLGDEASFKNVGRRYPLADEPNNGEKDPEKFASALYETYRGNLVHSLGIVTEVRGPKKQRVRVVAPTTVTTKVVRPRRGLTEHQLRATADSLFGLPAGPEFRGPSVGDQRQGILRGEGKPRVGPPSRPALGESSCR
jgi:hypothetical protein